MLDRTVKRSLTVAALLAALAGAYAGFGNPQLVGHAHAIGPASVPESGRATMTVPDFSAIAERCGPAVVNISVTANAKMSSRNRIPGLPQLDPDDPFFEFFRGFRAPAPENNVPLKSLGSGFIVSADGLVLTNAHVVDGADEVTVKLTDMREFKAKVLGIDKLTDVAVLRIPAKNLPSLRLGDPARTHVGEWVLAIGSPFGFENSVTAGIVSAKSRSLPDDSFVPFIQTDVAVNPGNSGGPLINLNGEVIGINSQIYSRSGGYQGLSFAIPIDVAVGVEQQIVQNGKVSHGRLGIAIQEVSPALAESFGLKNSSGALISSVEKGSPAAKAGLEPGDIVLKLNGTDINRSSDLPPLVAALKPGTRVDLKVWRKGQARDLTAAVGELKEPKVAANTNGGGGQADKSRFGLAVRPLTPEERQEADVASGGLVVEDVSGPAARAGIRPGDIILSLNGEPVKSADQLRTLVSKAGKHAALLIERDNSKLFVPLDLG